MPLIFRRSCSRSCSIASIRVWDLALSSCHILLRASRSLRLRRRLSASEQKAW
jgi:hypothetical protein